VYEKVDLREGAIAAIMALADNGKNVSVVVSDSTSTSRIGPFQKKYPERVVNVGIAEQTLVGVAAGLALGGQIAFTANASPFLLSRANEQVKNDICYSETNVKMLGLNAGVAYGSLGSTHHAIDDISITRGFGNVHIYAPCDVIETEQVVAYAASIAGPVYIRLDSAALPVVHNASYIFKPGEPDGLRQGESVAIVALGSVVGEALGACDSLEKDGIVPTLVNLSSIRPLNESAYLEILGCHDAIVTVEEHSLHGGIGALTAVLLAKAGLRKKFVMLGISQGEFAHYGTRKRIRAHYGIDAAGIDRAVRGLA
jgi:transketolase